MSKLIPQSLLNSLPDLYETEDIKDPICHIKLFTPDANWTWYIIELSKADATTCFGYVQGLESELGYFSLEELESIRGSLGVAVERDLSFKPTSLSKIKEDERE
ncbi:MAG: DUF2958 domain-containing protein [Thiovulaceae bacterium]|nr:DUF2958 domain-containing protein [Sulfurimonadaceae bacterium]